MTKNEYADESTWHINCRQHEIRDVLSKLSVNIPLIDTIVQFVANLWKLTVTKTPERMTIEHEFQSSRPTIANERRIYPMWKDTRGTIYGKKGLKGAKDRFKAIFLMQIYQFFANAGSDGSDGSDGSNGRNGSNGSNAGSNGAGWQVTGHPTTASRLIVKDRSVLGDAKPV